MQRNYAILALTVVSGGVLFGALSTYRSASHAAPAPKITPLKAGRAPVIVELFTSEGCSSCPSADKLLAQLKRDQPVGGAEILALSEHVDYWNSRSWADPYSSAAFSGRQEAYRKALRLDNVYTPQMVVDGRTEFVGSDDERAASAIAQAAKTAKTDVELTGEAKDGNLQLKVKTGTVTGLAAGEKADALLAITEDNLHSQVRGGENSGRRLDHAAVVRELKRIGTATRNGGLETTLTVPLKANWKRGDLRAIVFLQAQNSKRILGSAAVSVK